MENIAGDNIGKFSCLDYLEEIALAVGLPMNADNEYSKNLREKTLAIGYQFVKFANVFSRHCFPLYGIVHILLVKTYGYVCTVIFSKEKMQLQCKGAIT